MSFLTSTAVEDAIRDSAIHHWPMDEGSGTTLTDVVGSEDGSINGPTWISGTWYDGFALDADGIDDFVDFSNSILPSDNFTVLATIDIQGPLENNRVLYDGVQTHSLRTNDISSSGNPDSGFYFDYNAEQSGAYLNPIPSGRFRAAFGADNGAAFMFINGSDTDVNISTESTGYPTSDVRFFDRGDGSESDSILDNIIVANDVLTQSEIEADFNAQPWS